MNDGGPGAGQFCNLYGAPGDALFASGITLMPRVTIDSSSVENPADGNNGVHVSFNDGVTNKIARAVVLKAGPNQVRVAVARAGGTYSTGFVLRGLEADTGPAGADPSPAGRYGPPTGRRSRIPRSQASSVAR
jgi:hypothetical protein